MYSFFMKYLATNRKKAKYIIFLFETDTKRSPARSPATKKGRSPRGATGPNISKVIFI
jgi:hypothetical protein